LDEGEIRMEVEDIFIHPNFDEVLNDFDVAVVKVRPPPDGLCSQGKVWPACWPVKGGGNRRAKPTSREQLRRLLRLPGGRLGLRLQRGGRARQQSAPGCGHARVQVPVSSVPDPAAGESSQ
jgi:hypothetical protein